MAAWGAMQSGEHVGEAPTTPRPTMHGVWKAAVATEVREQEPSSQDGCCPTTSSAGLELPREKFAMATHDFHPRHEEALQLNAGQTVKLLSDQPEGEWWQVRVGSQIGYVPANHLQACSPSQTVPRRINVAPTRSVSPPSAGDDSWTRDEGNSWVAASPVPSPIKQRASPAAQSPAAARLQATAASIGAAADFEPSPRMTAVAALSRNDLDHWLR